MCYSKSVKGFALCIKDTIVIVGKNVPCDSNKKIKDPRLAAGAALAC